MIDTIKLQLLKEDYLVTEPDLFSHRFAPVNESSLEELEQFTKDFHSYREYIQSPPLGFRQAGEVHPYVKIEEKYNKNYNKYTCDLKSLFSCPKLLIGENISEVREGDFLDVAYTLLSRLDYMGIKTSDEAIANAIVTKIDFCKNIPFPSMEEANLFLEKLSKCAFPYLESSNTRYQNNGRAAHFWSGIFEINFYLKYYDILDSEDRAIDKHRTLQEREIAEQAKKNKFIPPVIRMEIRCNGKRSVSDHIKAATGIEKEDWRFEEVFSDELCHQVMQYYWKKLINDKANTLLLTQYSDEDICRKVVVEYAGQRPKATIEAFGFYYIMKTIGLRPFQQVFRQNYSRDTWHEKRSSVLDSIITIMKGSTKLIDIVSEVVNKPSSPSII